MTDERKTIRVGVWRQRGRRVVTGLNVLASVILMTVAVVLLNVLVNRLPYRLCLDAHARHELSPRTMEMLKDLQGTVEVVAFLSSNESDYDDVRALLREYEYAVAEIEGFDLNIILVNPSRDLARTRELARQYDVKSEDVIVFACGGRRKYVSVENLVQYKVELTRKGVSRRVIGFLGEQAFSSAILSVTQQKTPVIYFVGGHGEREPDDFNRQGGYSGIARIMRRDNMNVCTLQLASGEGVPDDCSALIVAGPDRKYSNEEIHYITEYLSKRHGRVLFLLDPSVNSGLENLLQKWGVNPAKGVAAGATYTGHELVVGISGEHPVTRGFKNINVMFYMPRPILKSKDSAGAAADRARVTVLASTGKEGWIEHNLSQDPPRYDKGIDTPGPVSVAVAAEKGGGLNSMEVELQPTRLVVIGDSYFVSNAALKGGLGANAALFLAVVNWLVDRDTLLRIASRPPADLNPGMSREQWKDAFMVMVLVVPGLIALFGLFVWAVRRR